MIGKTISHFKIQKYIGEGGMGKVYLALDTGLQREVAIKFLQPHLIKDEKIKSRFKQEALTLAALNHPNIITIYEVGDFEGSSFIVTEYVKGESLENILFNQSLSVKQALEISIQLCEGLKEAHLQGIIHRDIKPGNLLIEKNGHVKILDFGLAKLKEIERKTSTLTTLGTLYYLSPEQIQNSNIDQRADIFAVGIVLYEMISGQLPFKGDYEASVIYSILNEDPEPLARYKSGISDNLQNIVRKALRKNPEKRYQHVDDLLSDLKNELSEIDPSVKSIKATEDKTIRKLAAIMFTDIVGYSHMMGKDEEKTFKLLEDYDSIVAPIVIKQNGRILKKIGDGLFCEFSSAIEAVECSIIIQNALQDYNTQRAGDFQLKVRIGIHVGDVIRKDNDLFGDGVNVAARIEPLAPPGGIYISDTVYSAISGHPRFEINIIGPTTLKNINKKHTLYQIITGFEESIVKLKTIKSGSQYPALNMPVATIKALYQRLIKNHKYIWVSGFVIFIVTGIILLTTSKFFFDSSVADSADNSKNQSSLIVEDKLSKYPEVSKLLQSEQSKRFISEVLRIKDPKTLLGQLEENRNLGRMTFGRKGDYSDLEGKYIIILDEQNIYALLIYHDQKFFDVIGENMYNDLSQTFRGKREIWIDLLKSM